MSMPHAVAAHQKAFRSMRMRRHSPLRVAGAIVALLTAAVVMSGCGILEPTRDADGLIVRPTVMPSPDVLVGDCFSFVDGSELAYARVVPCTDPHSHIVFKKGTLSESTVSLTGSTQAAVDTACEAAFDAFIDSRPGRPKPEQEFIVSQEQKPGGLVTYYSCLATEPV